MGLHHSYLDFIHSNQLDATSKTNLEKSQRSYAGGNQWKAAILLKDINTVMPRSTYVITPVKKID